MNIKLFLCTSLRYVFFSVPDGANLIDIILENLGAAELEPQIFLYTSAFRYNG